jgi:hypothetical protein
MDSDEFLASIPVMSVWPLMTTRTEVPRSRRTFARTRESIFVSRIRVLFVGNVTVTTTVSVVGRAEPDPTIEGPMRRFGGRVTSKTPALREESADTISAVVPSAKSEKQWSMSPVFMPSPRFSGADHDVNVLSSRRVTNTS